MKNKLTDLNDHLFAQIERLADEDLTPEEINSECRRAIAMVAVADQIIRGAAVSLQVAKMVSDFDGSDPRPYLPVVERRADLAKGGKALTLVANK